MNAAAMVNVVRKLVKLRLKRSKIIPNHNKTLYCVPLLIFCKFIITVLKDPFRNLKTCLSSAYKNKGCTKTKLKTHSYQICTKLFIDRAMKPLLVTRNFYANIVYITNLIGHGDIM